MKFKKKKKKKDWGNTKIKTTYLLRFWQANIFFQYISKWNSATKFLYSRHCKTRRNLRQKHYTRSKTNKLRNPSNRRSSRREISSTFRSPTKTTNPAWIPSAQPFQTRLIHSTTKTNSKELLFHANRQRTRTNKPVLQQVSHPGRPNPRKRANKNNNNRQNHSPTKLKPARIQQAIRRTKESRITAATNYIAQKAN